MIRLPAGQFQVSYDKPFLELLEAGFGSHLEMECLCGLIRSHLDQVKRNGSAEKPKLFEIGTHRGAGICHFHDMAPELEMHSLNVLPEQLTAPPRQMASEIVAPSEIGRYARERGIAYTQHLADSRTFDWESLAATDRFDIVFIDGCHEQPFVIADTLNALRILKPDGMIIWHDYKVIDQPGREVFIAVNDMDQHEFGGQVRHIEGTWLAFVMAADLRRSRGDRGAAPAKASDRLPPAMPPRLPLSDEIAAHLARERRIVFREKVRHLPEVRKVVFFSDHHRPVWPDDADMTAPDKRYVVTRDPRQITTADIVIFHLPQAPAFNLLPKREGQIWVGVTMESDGHYPWQAEPRAVSCLDLLMSFHAHADVRLNYTLPGTLAELQAAVPAKDPEKLVCAFISNDHSLSRRERLVEQLERLLPVHHFGKWHYNQPGPRREGREAKLEILRQYHYCLALENTLEPDYVTEKWYDCLVAGCVPLYYGAPNIDEYAPGPGAFLNVRSFGPLAKLAAAVRERASDPERYRSFFEWKQNLRPDFRNLYADEMNKLPLLAKVDRMIRLARGEA